MPRRRQDRQRHHRSREGSSAGQMGRALCGRRFPGRRGRQLPHEQQRGHRQSRRGVAGRRARRVQARPSQRPRQLRPIGQRCLSHRHARGDVARAGEAVLRPRQPRRRARREG